MKKSELKLFERRLNIALSQNASMRGVLRQIANGKRRTRDAVLAKSCLVFLEACEIEAIKSGYAKGFK